MTNAVWKNSDREKPRRVGTEPASAPPLDATQTALLSRLYYDEGYTVGRDRLYKLTTRRFPEAAISRRQVWFWLRRQYTNQVHRPFKKPVGVQPFAVDAPFRLWLGDLFTPPRPGGTGGTGGAPRGRWNYVFNVVDAFSRRAYLERLSTKRPAEVFTAFERIVARAGRPPRRFHTDQGTEFKSSFARGLARRGIAQSFGAPGRPTNQAIVERANLTVQGLLARGRTARGEHSPSWWDPATLARAERNYNNLAHRSLQMRSPCEVEALGPAEWREIARRAGSRWNRAHATVREESRVRVGDTVRLALALKRKNPLSRGANPSWSANVYTVVRAIRPAGRRVATLYRVRSAGGETIAGTYTVADLQRVDGVELGKYVARDEQQRRQRREEAERAAAARQGRAARAAARAAAPTRYEVRARALVGRQVQAADGDTGTVDAIARRTVGGRRQWRVRVRWGDGAARWYRAAEIERELRGPDAG